MSAPANMRWEAWTDECGVEAVLKNRPMGIDRVQSRYQDKQAPWTTTRRVAELLRAWTS